MTNEYRSPDNEPIRQPFRVQFPDRKPLITYILIGITTFIFVLQFGVQYFIGSDLLFFYGGKINQFIMDGQVWRLITPALLHGSFLHVAMNMYALYVIGQRLERFYGHWRFLLLYVLSAFAGNVLSFVLSPTPSLGASTAIFGLFIAEGMFIYQNRDLFGKERTRQALLNLLVVLIINLAYGFMRRIQIDNYGHIGGMLGGAFFAWKAGPLLKVTGEPPFFTINDVRKKHEVLMASLVVFIGFTLIALIPFII